MCKLVVNETRVNVANYIILIYTKFPKQIKKYSDIK